MKLRTTGSLAAAFALVLGMVIAPMAVAPANAASTITVGSLAGKIYFAAGSSKLSTASKAKLLSQFAARPYASRIDLVGYVQSTGLDGGRRSLAKARAVAIQSYLKAKKIGKTIVVHVGNLSKTNAKLTTARRVNVWVRNAYTVTYDYQTTGVVDTTASYLQASTGLTLPAPTKPGYLFVGWFTGVNSGVKITGPFVPVAPITLYARWGTEQTVSFDANSASGTPPSSMVYDPRTDGVTLPTTTTMTKSGFSFDGWSLTAGGAKLTSPYAPTADVKLYARWTTTVEYDGNGNTSGTAPSKVTWAYGATAITLPKVGNLVKTGYVFAGWSTTKTGSAVSDPFTPTGTTLLYARWISGPVITTETVILVGDSNPQIIIKGSNFDTGIRDRDLDISYGRTGLSDCTISDATSTAITLDCSGTAKAGTLAIQVLANGYDPTAPIDSNVLLIVVPVHGISSTDEINNGDLDPDITITSENFKTGVDLGDFVIYKDATKLSCTTTPLTRTSSTEVVIHCKGTARTGTLTIQALDSAYSDGSGDSNVLSFVVEAPVIDSTSKIENHVGPVSITITNTSGAPFSTNLTTLDTYTTIVVGTTKLTSCDVTDVAVDGSSLTVECAGVPVKGTLTVQVQKSGYNPVDNAPSNVLEFVVPAPLIETTHSDVLTNGASPGSITITGLGFDPDLAIGDISFSGTSTTGISCALGSHSETDIVLNCTGTAKQGRLGISVSSSGYLPSDTTSSNVLYFTVPPAIDSDTSTLTSTITITTTDFFRSGLTCTGYFTFTYDSGLTLTPSCVRASDGKSIAITFAGTLTSGKSVDIVAKTGAFSPTAYAVSNKLTFTAA